MRKHIQLSISKCARCGGDHANLVFTRMKRPATFMESVIATHWAECPGEYAPILMNLTELEE